MMRAVSTIRPRLCEFRTRALAWRRELTGAERVALAFGFAAFTGVMAQVQLPLPGTPVPFTMQVFAVLIAGVLLGRGYGALSQGVYVAMGAVGVPWFAGLTGGGAILTGITGGYLVGFVLAAWLIGRLVDGRRGRPGFVLLLGAMVAGVVVIHACGALHIGLVLGRGAGLAWWWGVMPFIGLDLAKALMAAGVALAVLPPDGAKGTTDGAARQA